MLFDDVINYSYMMYHKLLGNTERALYTSIGKITFVLVCASLLKHTQGYMYYDKSFTYMATLS